MGLNAMKWAWVANVLVLGASVLVLGGCTMFKDTDDIEVDASNNLNNLNNLNLNNLNLDNLNNLNNLDLNNLNNTNNATTTRGQVCEPSTPLRSGACRVVAQDCDSPAEMCTLAFKPCDTISDCPAGDMCIDDAQFGKVCRDVDGNPDTIPLCTIDSAGPKLEGESCGEQKCAEGLACRGTCQKYCELENALGCKPEQFCAPKPGMVRWGYGVCQTDCL